MAGDGFLFARQLQCFRRSASLSQHELAERAGLSIRAISNLESGRALWPHPQTVRRLAEALGLTGDEYADFVSSAGRRLVGGEPGLPSAQPGDRRTQAVARTGVPSQLPGQVRQFVGRGGEFAALDHLVSSVEAEPRPWALIVAICGMPGVGKTALAVHWAHRIAHQFPDGQLYVDLRGYGPSGEAFLATDALASLLHSLGVAEPEISDSADERAAAYRSLLAGKRMLVVLDNARDAEQVRPLLPGSATCVTIVTSRDALGGLVAMNGAVRLELDVLPPQEATKLLFGLTSRGQDGDLAAGEELADHCGRLPFALRVAVELAEMHGLTLADLAAQTASLRHRLDVLETDADMHTALRSLFWWSYRGLSPAAALMFRLLCVHPGPDISLQAAADLAELPGARARQVLAELTSAHMLNECLPERFSCHNLLRIYGAELAVTHDWTGPAFVETVTSGKVRAPGIEESIAR